MTRLLEVAVAAERPDKTAEPEVAAGEATAALALSATLPALTFIMQAAAAVAGARLLVAQALAV
jgi:hypothetical protein